MSSPVAIPIEIEAALVWNKPRLLASDELASRAFVAALDPPPVKLDESAEGPLATAATSIVAERSGEAEAAARGFRQLVDSDEPFVSLLGLMLRCWSSGKHNSEDFDRAAAIVQETPDRLLAARLLMKLATFALDKQDVQRFASYLDEAHTAAPQGTRLHHAITFVMASYSAQFVTQADGSDDDPLVDYEWIEALATQAARNELVELLKARAQNPWSWSIRMGRTNADVSIAAELQATWAGALWLRDGIRRQVAAQLLAQPTPSPYQTLFGLSLWLASRGDNVAQILAAAEPSFESGTADALLLPQLPMHVIAAYGDRRVMETANALWDLVSDETVEAVIAEIRPESSDSPFNDAAVFWERAALRIPDTWQELVRLLDDGQVSRVVSELSAATVDLLSPEAATYLLERAGITRGEVGSLGLVLLWHKLALPVPDLVTVPLDVVVQVANTKPEALVEPTYEIAETVLRTTLAETVASARRGTFPMASSSAGGIAAVASARGAIHDETLALLVETALAPDLVGHLRFESMIALAELTGRGLVPAEVLPRFADVPAPREEPFPAGMPITPALLNAAALGVRALVLTHDEQVRLFTLSRDPDARARQIIARVAAGFLSIETSPPVEAALVAALFDPEPSVVHAALRALRDVQLSEFSHDAVLSRLVRIYDLYSRRERAEVVRAVKSLRSRAAEPLVADILKRAETDRSWVVRNAVNS